MERLQAEINNLREQKQQDVSEQGLLIGEKDAAIGELKANWKQLTRTPQT